MGIEKIDDKRDHDNGEDGDEDEGDDAVRAKGAFIKLNLTLVVVALQADGL